MPYFEAQTDRYQAAVLWLLTGYDSYGQPAVGEPIEVRVRWVDQRSEQLDPQGNTVTVDATVILPPDYESVVGSEMWLGSLDDWYATGSAGQPDDVLQVKTYNKSSDMKNRFVRRVAGLMRKHDK